MFIGRSKEIATIHNYYNKKQSALMVIYGRRRVGKSFLINHACAGKLQLSFEGIESVHTKGQIAHFLKTLSKQTSNPFYLKMTLHSWSEVFDLLTSEIDKFDKKVIIVFDEFQWMACGQGKLVALLKHYWDTKWKQRKVLLILCGSIATFMIKHVIDSKALYGRIDKEICLGPLTPSESYLMLKRRGPLEALKYQTIFGGIPRYLELINQSKSFEKNINELCFMSDGYFINEIDKIFFSQFKEPQVYKKIVTLLSKGNYSLDEIATKLKIKSGGSLKTYLSNMEKSGLIRCYTPFNTRSRKTQRYKLFDEFLIFYFKYMLPHLAIIKENSRQNLFKSLITPKWAGWTGIAFENFCIKNAMYIANVLGFEDEVISFGPLQGTSANKFQIGLLYQRSNVVTLCEIKFHETPIDTWIIPEIEKKIVNIKSVHITDNIEKMIVAPMGITKALKDSEYFHHVVTLTDLYREASV